MDRFAPVRRWGMLPTTGEHNLGAISRVEGFVEQTSHRRTFIDKNTDEAARLCQRQRVTQQVAQPCPFRHAHGEQPPVEP